MATTTLARPEQKERELVRGPLGRWFDRDLRWMRQISRDMDRLFGDFGVRPLAFEPRIAEMTWAPEMEIFERDGRFVVRADLPGMKKDDIKVNIQENVLTIEGERKVEEEVKKDNFHRTERLYGTFFRSLPLPEGVKMDQVQAMFKDGVLEVTMPIEEAKKAAKNVEVKVQ
jgi:HSP20 family protein